MPIPQSVLDLIDQFEANRDDYRAQSYNETELRREFLDPFFTALGWNVDNSGPKGGLSAARRDVKHEYSLKVEGDKSGETKNRAPDYAFRIGEVDTNPVFFVEAKKPAVNVRDNDKFAFQTREYGWNAKLPFCVLTDFEEFAIYDCRSAPKVTDGVGVGRVDYFTCDQYAEKWDVIANLFGREAVKTGALAKRALAEQKKGAVTVDAAFLSLIGLWREKLADDIVRRNPKLDSADLNFAVQMTIDRIIFLRMAEDRDLEPWGTLQTISRKKDIYAALLERFEHADDRYNSGLFHFPNTRRSGKKRPGFEDTLSKTLKIGDEVLSDVIIKSLYRPSPFNFRVMPIEILGQVYEQFLGKVITVSDTDPKTGLRIARGAHIDDKPEVRKAGGVYYTPSYIVDAIVKQTVGALCEGKTPKQLETLRVLDPASGSGSFLIGAYGYLLAYHLDFYSKDEARYLKGKDAPLFATPDPLDETKTVVRLTTREKKRILLGNIYGVDIDRQAVEVTKLSLLLRVLEDESSEGLKLLNEPALPDLDNNIRCGNSLIGSDFYDTTKGGIERETLSDDEQNRVNAFDWATVENFPRSFDAIIGNPPYIRIQALNEWAPLEVAHFKRTYATAVKGNYDIYVMFIERALELMSERGRLGFILPHKFFNAQYGEATRELLSKGRHLREVVHFGDRQIFDGASTYTCLLYADKTPSETVAITRVPDLEAWQSGTQPASGQVSAASLSGAAWNFSVGDSGPLFDKLAAMPVKLGDIADRMYQGPITSADDVYLFKNFADGSKKGLTKVFSEQTKKFIEIETEILKPVIRSGNVFGYRAGVTAYVLFPYEVENCSARLFTEIEMKKNFPLAWEYLSNVREVLEEREKGKFKDSKWYRFGRTQNLGLWEQPKLLIPYMVNKLVSYPDRKDGFYFINVTTGGYGVTFSEPSTNLLYISGLLNSSLLDFFFKKISTTFRGGYFAANKQYIEQLPIPTIDFSDAADKARHDALVKLVEQMLRLHSQLAETQNPATKANLAARIASADAQIDALVFALYGLDDAEIALVAAA